MWARQIVSFSFIFFWLLIELKIQLHDLLLLAEANASFRQIKQIIYNKNIYYLNQSIQFILEVNTWYPALSQDHLCIPWKAIFTSGPVWGIIFGHLASDWGLYTILICLPMFLVDILHFDIQTVSFTAFRLVSVIHFLLFLLS